MKFFCVLFLLFLSACSQNNDSNSLPKSRVLAVVGDQNVTQGLLDAFMKSNAIKPSSDTQVALALDALIGEVAMSNISAKKKIPLSEEQLNMIYYLKLRAHSQNAQRDYISTNPISTEETQREYDTIKKSTGAHEYYVHHMLFDDEVEAIKALESVTESGDYFSQEQLYLQSSNKTGVGELGWVNLKQLPQSFGEILPQTEENTVIPNVVQSQFGAHVIFLKEKRPFTPPSFEEVKDGIIKSLKAKQLSKFKQISIAKAKVKLHK